jgi:hypothetical protein
MAKLTPIPLHPAHAALVRAQAFDILAPHLARELRQTLATDIAGALATPQPPPYEPDPTPADHDQRIAKADEALANDEPVEPGLSSLERSLLTPQGANNAGKINLADYLFAKGHRHEELGAIVSRFEREVIDHLREVHHIVPVFLRLASDATPTKPLAYTFPERYRSIIDAVYLANIYDVLCDAGHYVAAEAFADARRAA